MQKIAWYSLVDTKKDLGTAEALLLLSKEKKGPIVIRVITFLHHWCGKAQI